MPDRPNIVFVFSDQQRADTMACYGNDWLRVPNLNALADRSHVFRHAYVAQAVCTPSRATLLTGLFPHTAGPIVNRIALPDRIQSIAEMVGDDYHCGYFGKWHLGNDSAAQHGFTTWHPTEDNKREMNRVDDLPMSPYFTHLVSHGFKPDGLGPDGSPIFTPDQRAKLPPELQMASYLGDRASEFIVEHRQRPFVLYVSTYEPHPPYWGPYDGAYDPETIPVGPAFLKRPEAGSMFARSRSDYFMQFIDGADPSDDAYITGNMAKGHDLTTEAGWRKLRASYYSNVMLVDDMVGKILRAISHAGIASRTIVVFTSDHGEMAGDHGMLEKRMFYEESATVPLLLHVPWIPAERCPIEGSVSQVDLVPTLLDLISGSIPTHLQGRSLLSVLDGKRELDDNDVFMEWSGIGEVADRNLGSAAINRANRSAWRSVVSGRWKLNACADDRCELFDLNTDPFEMRNRFDDPECRPKVADLAGRLRAWQRRTGDQTVLPEMG